MKTGTPEQQHLARYERNPIYAEAWRKKHAHQQIQCESPLSNGQHANATPIIEAMNSTSTPESFFNSYWFGVLVIVIFVTLVLTT